MRATGTRTTIALGMTLAAMLAGCQAPPGGVAPMAGAGDPNRLSPEVVERAPLASDITAVLSHYNMYPWLQYDMLDPRPQGFYIASLYLVSAATGKGAFGNGTIHVHLYRVDQDPAGGEQRNLVHTWSLTPEQAKPYRSTRRTFMGVGYQLRLRWPEGLDLLDRQVMVVVDFARPDGKIIRSSPKFLKVPARMGG